MEEEEEGRKVGSWGEGRTWGGKRGWRGGETLREVEELFTWALLAGRYERSDLRYSFCS